MTITRTMMKISCADPRRAQIIFLILRSLDLTNVQIMQVLSRGVAPPDSW